MKMRQISYMIILILSILSCESNLNHKIFYYSNGNKKYEYDIDINNKVQGKAFNYYENGKLKGILYFKNDISYGKTYKFHKNGMIKIISSIYKNQFIDTLYRFEESGKLSNKYIFAKGLNQDTIKEIEYYPNGKVKFEQASIQGDEKLFGVKSMFSYIQFNSNGIVDYKNSLFTWIKYLNSKGTKIKFTLCDGTQNYPTKSETDYYRDSVYIYIIKSFDKDIFNPFNQIRRIGYSKWNKLILDVNENDYSNGRLNISICQQLKNKTSRTLKSGNVRVQLIKGDLSRYHNVHGIEK